MNYQTAFYLSMVLYVLQVTFYFTGTVAFVKYVLKEALR